MVVHMLTPHVCLYAAVCVCVCTLCVCVYTLCVYVHVVCVHFMCVHFVCAYGYTLFVYVQVCVYFVCVHVCVYTCIQKLFTYLSLSPDYITAHGDSEHSVDLLMETSVLFRFVSVVLGTVKLGLYIGEAIDLGLFILVYMCVVCMCVYTSW